MPKKKYEKHSEVSMEKKRFQCNGENYLTWSDLWQCGAAVIQGPSSPYVSDELQQVNNTKEVSQPRCVFIDALK